MARIVLVEDSATTRELLVGTLRAEGHAVEPFDEAEAALATVQRDPPDLLVTDVVLPGMSGIQLVEAVRARHQRLALPIVIVSSLEETDEVARGYAAGADDYLLKPLQPAELSARVRVLLARREHARAAAPEEPRWRRYELLEQLGRGEWVMIHRARRRGDGLEVVLKAVTPGAPGAQTLRLLAEAELLRSLGEVPNLVRVRDVGQDGGSAYYAMQWVPGETLAARLEREGALAPGAAARVGGDLAGALSGLAEERVVHGDVKPTNTVVTEEQGVVLIDFGLAHRSGQEADHGGTLLYVAPEVLRGAPSEPASDVYGLGVLLFETLSGTLPFDARGDQLAAQKIDGAPPDLGALLARDVPPGLIAVVESCLEDTPDNRPSAAEVGLALLPYRGGS
ncbi:MAG: protein kinase [Planctomycetota bacterium]